MAAPKTNEVPYRNPLVTAQGIVSDVWSKFFRNAMDAIDPLGTEKFFPLVNNQGSAADIDGLKFSQESVSQVTVEYLIQRVTTGGGATEKIQSGIFILTYLPTTSSWSLVTIGTPGPDVSGVTLSVTSTGQVQYTSTNFSGTESISKITYRARTLAAKNSLYSLVGK